MVRAARSLAFDTNHQAAQAKKHSRSPALHPIILNPSALWSKLVREPNLKNMLHHQEFIRDRERAIGRGSTAAAGSHIRKAEAARAAGGICEIGETILHPRYPMRAEQHVRADACRPAKVGRRVRDGGRPKRSGEVITGGAVEHIRSKRAGAVPNRDYSPARAVIEAGQLSGSPLSHSCC
jgi:hypothetical protein